MFIGYKRVTKLICMYKYYVGISGKYLKWNDKKCHFYICILGKFLVKLRAV